MWLLLSAISTLCLALVWVRRCCCCCFDSVDVTFSGVTASNTCLPDDTKCTSLTGFDGTYTLTGGCESFTATFAYTGANFDVYLSAGCGGGVIATWQSTHVTFDVTIDRDGCEIILVRATLTIVQTSGIFPTPPAFVVPFSHAAFPIGSGPTALGAAGANDAAVGPGTGGTATVVETP